MATIDEVYNEFIASDEQTKAAVLESAKTPEGLAALLAEHGCSATPEEFTAYLKGKSATGNLSDEELSSVAGGCNEETLDKISNWICLC